MRYYEVPGYDRPLLLSEEHAALLKADAVPEVPPPARNARVDDWRVYATTQGMDPDAVATWTRSDLIETFGG